jgi:hypothetical protein
MRAWSTIVASGPCLMVNLSAERGKQVLPNRQYLRRAELKSQHRSGLRRRIGLAIRGVDA